jgi:uncharacterized protein (TIGR02996 family)
MTAEERGLLAAVVANADDDVPRLVYADWLDEHDRPERAEFIRVQCRLAAVAPDDPDYPELLDRQSELALWLEAHEPVKDTLGRLGLQPDFGYDEYVRGFPITAARDEFGGSGRNVVPRLCAAVAKLVAETTIRELRLYGYSPGEIAEFVQQPVVGQLRGLILQPSTGEGEFELLTDEDDVSEWVPRIDSSEAAEVVRALAESPHVAGLRDLRLFVPLSRAEALVLASTTTLGGLRRLHVDFHPNDPEGVRTLGRAGWFRNLHHLSVGDRHGNPVLMALCKLPPFPNLHTLDLGDGSYDAAGVTFLAKSEAFPRVADLDLGRTRIRGAGVKALAAAKGWRLSSLGLRACDIGTAGASALASSELLAGVRVLDLGANDIGPKGVSDLAKSPHAAGLRHLTLSFNGVGVTGLAVVARTPYLKGLTRLDLTSGPEFLGGIRGRDVSAFLGDLDMPNLRHLDLGGLPVGVNGAKKLARNPSLARLTSLVLDECRVGDAGLAALGESSHLRGLVRLSLFENGIGKGAGVLADPGVFPRAAWCSLSGNDIPAATRRKLAKRKGVRA